jgi:hypothetical protein
MDRSAEEDSNQQVASLPRPKPNAANCGLGNRANIALFTSRPLVLIAMFLAANRKNRGASPRDSAKKRNFKTGYTPSKLALQALMTCNSA